MTKKVILGIGLVVVLLAVVFWTTDKSNDYKEEDGEKMETKEQLEEKKKLVGQGSLSELLLRNENLKCSVVYRGDNAQNQTVEGTYFTSQQRLRGDFVTTDSTTEIASSMIMIGDTLYTWSEIDGEMYGAKITVDKTNENEVDLREPVPVDSQVDYDCVVWSDVDGSIFEPPKNIIFRDLTNITNQGMEYGNIYGDVNTGVSQCDVCASLPAGEQKDQCLITFACE